MFSKNYIHILNMQVFCSRKENLCKMAKIYSGKRSYSIAVCFTFQQDCSNSQRGCKDRPGNQKIYFKQNPANNLCTYQCLPPTGGGRAYRGYWHRCLARVWGKWAIIDTGVSPGAGLLAFLVEKDWERVIVHTREELARRPTEQA